LTVSVCAFSNFLSLSLLLICRLILVCAFVTYTFLHFQLKSF
jgi:hypothetical protein